MQRRVPGSGGGGGCAMTRAESRAAANALRDGTDREGARDLGLHKGEGINKILTIRSMMNGPG